MPDWLWLACLHCALLGGLCAALEHVSRKRALRAAVRPYSALPPVPSLPAVSCEVDLLLSETELAGKIRARRQPWLYMTELRVLAVITVGRTIAPSTRELLSRLIRLKPLTEYDEEAASVAADIAGDTRSESCVPALLEAMHSDSDLVRFHAIRGLGKLGARQAAEWLRYIATYDFVGEIRLAALTAGNDLRLRGGSRP